MLKVYEYPKCSTCKNAIKFLEKKRVPFKKIAIVDQPPSKAELSEMLCYLGGNLRKLFNTSGLLYKELGLATKLDSLAQKEALDLLAKHGMLVKRPFVLAKNKGWVGFNEAEWAEHLKNL